RNAGNLFGMTRTFQPGWFGPPFRREAHSSGGVWLSLPGQNGQLTGSGSLGGWANSCGRLARSVAMITQPSVIKSLRSSGIRLLRVDYIDTVSERATLRAAPPRHNLTNHFAIVAALHASASKKPVSHNASETNRNGHNSQKRLESLLPRGTS